MHADVTVTIGRSLTIEGVHRVARQGAAASLDAAASQALATTRHELEADIERGDTIYGVNTGFGALSESRVPTDQLKQLQRNLLRSHAVGVGEPLASDVVRALLLLRAHTLTLGASGVSPELPQFLLDLLHRGVVPVVPSQGSVGASGDLAPLAHLALPVIGEGRAWVDGACMGGGEALSKVGLEPFSLGIKEGLSLINGTQVTSAIGALAAQDAAELMVAADVIGSMSLDSQLGSLRAADPRIHAGKPHPGQRRTAELIRTLVSGSELNASHSNCGQVQDAYCLRCMPQVHGAVRQALHYVASTLEVEINSFTDNPLVLGRADGGYDVVSGGNFHAATVAVPLDHLTAALTTLATISERRTDRFMTTAGSRGLPPFLAQDPGLESGFMMAQVTASALASECKSLSFPASVDSIPTSAGKEDHVSMGPIAARKLARVVRNVAQCLAIEAAAAARALDLREPNTSGRLRPVHTAIRLHVAPFDGDRSMSDEIEALADAILRGELREAAGVEAELRPSQS